ncbi:hypothetical protein BFW38_05210 [Terasakiispira papahanaumokuakeensis]|uniref:Uncharacterized protein n=1 Tax=Terasakiispira papahanaumokuakeensis TaxID=197479 RepID=A0A1E2V7T5_9GAMM|nr:hypothetical protein [Terasakiispira papahanaumokuakeensis]ODC03034.1 hypothetical protein BFW38_05210 [Terasakiispira papahanaumokuakeensis]
MYKLPENFDLNFLLGCFLEMVCFGPNMTRLEFTRPEKSIGEEPYRVVICVEGPLYYQIKAQRVARNHSDSSTCAPLIDFVLHNVALVEQIGLSSLKILFDNSNYIEFIADEDAEFESYSIYLNSGEVIVV